MDVPYFRREIFAARYRKLEAARAERKVRRQAARKEVFEQIPCVL